MRPWVGIAGLVAGTAIGASMLALPLEVSHYGLLGGSLLLLLSWLLMYLTSLFTLEVTTAFSPGTHWVMMAKQLFGKTTASVIWLAYLLLLYSLLAAYLTAMAGWLNHVWHIPSWGAQLIWVALGILLLTLGTARVDQLNRWLFAGLIIAIGLLCLFLAHPQSITLPTLFKSASLNHVSILMTSFGFHVIIPSLYRYMPKDLGSIKRGLLLGSFVPLIFGLIWSIQVILLLPEDGQNSLAYLSQTGDIVYQLPRLLADKLHQPSIQLLVTVFSWLALVTSFLGISLSLNDIWSDLISSGFTNRVLHFSPWLTLLPPFFFAYSYPEGFLVALRYAAYLVVILNGLLPCLYLLRKRSLKLPSGYQTRIHHWCIGVLALVFMVWCLWYQPFIFQ
jgi:tyrosine-specific transport protein